MFVIDDNTFRLAKMSETLLRLSDSNRDENLMKYKQFVSEIDAKAFADILDEVGHVDEHNHSLESELKFLEGIDKTYERLLELRSGFVNVCEKYGDLTLRLSDLSILNIDYIRERINAIKGYLINLKNIETNKKKIDKLTIELAEHEKKREYNLKKLSEYEQSLVSDFLSVQGRRVVKGKLVPTNIIIEYEDIDLDFTRLLENKELLDEVMIKVNNSKDDALEMLKTTEICYNNALTKESKQFLDEARKEYLRAEYKLTMVKIVNLLSITFSDFEDVKKKREDLLELIEYRFSCLKCLGLVELKDKDLDPFYRTKVSEQLEVVSALSDNSRDINRITSKISELVKLTEELVEQKTSNQLILADTKKFINDKLSINDIDITGISLPKEEVVVISILPNQVRSVREPVCLNMSIVHRKAAGVINRVSKMFTDTVISPVEKVLVAPDLVIMPKVSSETDFNSELVDIEVPKLEVSDDKLVDLNIDLNNDKNVLFDDNLSNIESESVNDSLFETVSPFEEPIMFSERSDEQSEIISENDSSDIVDFSNLNGDISEDDTDDSGTTFWISKSVDEMFSDEQTGDVLLNVA